MTETERPPLVLTIHPPIPPDPWPEDTCMRRQTDPWWLASVEWQHARGLERDAWVRKLLPQAELAAEYWKSLWEYDSKFTEFPGWHYDPDGEVILEHEVLYRFVARIHAASSDYK